jgi:hypothetical protein
MQDFKLQTLNVEYTVITVAKSKEQSMLSGRRGNLHYKRFGFIFFTYAVPHLKTIVFFCESGVLEKL